MAEDANPASRRRMTIDAELSACRISECLPCMCPIQESCFQILSNMSPPVGKTRLSVRPRNAVECGGNCDDLVRHILVLVVLVRVEATPR